MSKKDSYSIQFLGIAEGKHQFDFRVNKDLFVQYEEDSIEDADINVVVNLEKSVRHLLLNFNIKGSITTICDRCLDTLKLDIDCSPHLHINFGDYTSDLSDIDDIMTLSRSEEKLDLSKHLYDYIMLNIPIQKTHNENSGSECNPEMLEQIEKYEIGNSDNIEETEIDPRWEKLKHLYN